MDVSSHRGTVGFKNLVHRIESREGISVSDLPGQLRAQKRIGDCPGIVDRRIEKIRVRPDIEIVLPLEKEGPLLGIEEAVAQVDIHLPRSEEHTSELQSR